VLYHACARQKALPPLLIQHPPLAQPVLLRTMTTHRSKQAVEGWTRVMQLNGKATTVVVALPRLLSSLHTPQVH
jgi:hypothetical protein